MMATMSPHLTNPKEIAEAGEKIYAERYKDRYEREYPGKFVVIDVRTGETYIGESAINALQQATAAAPSGAFHLIKIGAPGAFRVGYSGTVNGTLDWLFR